MFCNDMTHIFVVIDRNWLVDASYLDEMVYLHVGLETGQIYWTENVEICTYKDWQTDKGNNNHYQMSTELFWKYFV